MLPWYMPITPNRKMPTPKRCGFAEEEEDEVEEVVVEEEEVEIEIVNEIEG
jgi:hypothetical protein